VTRLAGIYGEPFAEQVAAFRLRLGNLIPTAKWDDIKRAQHDRGFMVAGAIKADLLADLGAAVDKAIAKGTSLEEFRHDFRAIVQKHGWHGWTGEGTKGGEAWRTRVIYKTNLSVTYAAGRMAQLVEAGFTLWVYRHGASLEPREQHLAWDGLILPPEHPFWATHAPPNGWGCSCYVLGARSIRGAVRLGGKPDLKLPENWQAQDPKTGAPVGIDKGWDYAPGATVTKTVSLAADKIRELPALLGAEFGATLDGLIDKVWPTWIADTLVKGSHDAWLVGTLASSTVKALEARGIAPQSAELLIRPGLLIGPKATRHEAAGNALTPADWLSLPWRIRQARAVLFDVQNRNLIYVLPGEGSGPQLAVRFDYRPKRQDAGLRENVVVSAYRVDISTIRARLKGGELQLLEGSVE
jgi:Phage Mu protein F like protein